MRRIAISLPEERHEQLRQDAFRARASIAELIRDRLQRSIERPRRHGSPEDAILKVASICRGPVLSRDIDDSLYGH